MQCQNWISVGWFFIISRILSNNFAGQKRYHCKYQDSCEIQPDLRFYIHHEIDMAYHGRYFLALAKYQCWVDDFNQLGVETQLKGWIFNHALRISVLSFKLFHAGTLVAIYGFQAALGNNSLLNDHPQVRLQWNSGSFFVQILVEIIYVTGVPFFFCMRG